ncbi:fumarate/nitrate reduction transcriptional regulator Fnr [Catenovulum sediminis]|uniref:Fumarate/nitrate reduction transcriptional regulator Fnr n=1 Tax=Catenovulum sediminis TaxID=1740262 RepID=A0ABV1RJC0_9ALTE
MPKADIVNNTIKCQNCSISQLCIPYSLNNNELKQLDNIIERKRPLQKGQHIVNSGDAFSALYAVRSGSFKSYITSRKGEEQITSFHLPGDIIGFDAIRNTQHPSSSIALETSMVCEIPYATLDTLTSEMPALRQQILRLMSNEISFDQDLFFLLSKKTAEERLATFIVQLSNRFRSRGLSAFEFKLSMTRGEIGNHLGLTVETISRLLNRFKKANLLEINGKYIKIINLEKLTDIANLLT